MDILCLLSVFSSLSADEESCLCGTVSHDPFYAKAIFLLDLSIRRHTPFNNDGWYFPDVASEFYPPVELREDIDDTYPFEGKIRWTVVKSYHWDKEYLLKNDGEYSHYSPSQTYINIPVKIIRELKWTDHPYVVVDYSFEIEHNHREKNVFNFHKSYGAIPQAFHVLISDIAMYYGKSESFLDARIRDLSDKIPVYEWGGLTERLTKKKTLVEKKQKIQLSCRESLDFTEQKAAEALAACLKSLDLCITNHHNPFAYVNRGLFYYLEGDTLNALGQLDAALEKMDNDDEEKLREEATFLKSQSELEAGLYADAILTLNGLIKKNPLNKDAYFERANAYFELGNFDLSLEDYVISEIKPQPISTNSIEMISFSLGLTKGILQGGVEAGVEFIPSILSSLQGIAHGLWAFAHDPVQISIEFVQASQACLNFIKEHTPQETLVELAPELRELIEKWDQLEDEKRGEITGRVIGKYGIDIFAGAGLTKVMKSYRELKRANNLLTFEAMTISERNKSLIKLEATRKAQATKERLQRGALKILPDDQGKHLIGHRNYDPAVKRSILQHPNPQKLVEDFAGKGMSAKNLPPGIPGYQEIVNFGEFIGYAIHRDTGEKIATSWGKIHYAKDGVHIVPTMPR